MSERTTMDEIANAIGLDAAMKIISIWGGHTMYVPDTIKPDHPIAQDLGYDIAVRLCAFIGSQTIRVPKKDFTHLRRKRIVRLLSQKGLSKDHIIDIMQVTQKTIDRDIARGVR